MFLWYQYLQRGSLPTVSTWLSQDNSCEVRWPEQDSNLLLSTLCINALLRLASRVLVSLYALRSTNISKYKIQNIPTQRCYCGGEVCSQNDCFATSPYCRSDVRISKNAGKQGLVEQQNSATVHPRLSEQVELKFLLRRSGTQQIRIIEEEHFTY